MHGSPVKKRVVERTVSADCRKLDVGKNHDCTATSKSQHNDDDVLNEQRSPTAIHRQVITRFHRSGSAKFPKLEDCAHFHYDFVSIGSIQVSLYEDDASQDKSHSAQQTADDDHFDSTPFCLQVSSASNHAPWIIQRTVASLKTLDRQLHRCVYDRKYSLLPCIGRDFCDDVNSVHHCGSLSPDLKHSLMLYFNRLSSIAGNMINCGAVLNWFEMDNRGNRIIVSDTDSAINTPAVGAAHVVNSYAAKAPDELSLEVGDIVSIIDMPPAHESSWWRGKNRFEVGFFPSSCVEVIGGSSVAECVASKHSSAQVKPVLRKRGKLIVRLRAFFSSRPERTRLKRSGIVKERVFGCDLGEHLLNSGHDVPTILKFCSELIEMYGVVDGIYRLSGISSNIQQLRNEFDDDRTPPLNDDIHVRDIHCVSSLLKLYFRELPNPLLTYQLYDKFVTAVQDDDERKLLRMHDVIQQLPPPHHRTCAFLMRHLSRMASFNEKTGMTCKNLAIVWAPNLLRCKDLEQQECSLAALKNVGIQAVVTEFLISHTDILFTDSFISRRREHPAGRKSARPKSLAVSTPTKLLSLEEARQKAVAACSAERQQVYLDVGGGPATLPPVYHTVIDLPKGKKWKQIKKSALSSRLKGMPRDGHQSDDNLLKPKEPSTSVELFSGDLIRQPSDLTCALEEATVQKLPFAAEYPTAWKASSLPTAESNMVDISCPSADNAVLTHDCTSSQGDCLVLLSLTSSVAAPGSDSSCCKPVDGHLRLRPDNTASPVESHLSDTEAGISDVSKTLSTCSGHVSCGSDEVFVTCSQNSLSTPLVEPSSSVACAAVPHHDGQDVLLAASVTNADDAFEVSPLRQLQSSLFDDIFCPSSPSESESEPLGGCKDALLNPDHCISDLCLEDDDNVSVFGAAGFQSPPTTDSPGNHNNAQATEPILFNALSVINDRIKHDCSNLLDMSKLDVSSFSNSYSPKAHMELDCQVSVFDDEQVNSSTSSVASNSPFRSPPKSSLFDKASMYRCTVPRNSDSPFRSPPKLSPSILDTKGMWNRTASVEDLQTTEMSPFESAVILLPSDVETCSAASDVLKAERTIICTSSPDTTYNLQVAEFSESVTDCPILTCDENLLNDVTEKDVTAVTVSGAMSECHSSPLMSHSAEYKLGWTSESSVAAVQDNFAKTPINEVKCDPLEVDDCRPRVEIKYRNGTMLHGSPYRDVYSTDKNGRQTSVKQLKCKFESQQDSVSQVGIKSSPENFALAFVPSTAEPNAPHKLHDMPSYKKKWEDVSRSEITDVTSANFSNSNGVQDSDTERNSECNSSVTVFKTADGVPVRDLKQCRQPSVSARISCFEPVMSVSSADCQKENKRARLSSCGSAVPDHEETKLNSTSHSVKEPFGKSRQRDADGWFVESPQRSHAKQYQRCSSAGHEDLLALLNIPASSAKNIPRVSERKRMFEMETAVPKVNSSDSISIVSCRSPAFECGQCLHGSQRLLSVDKENSLRGYGNNCHGRVNSRRSLFEGNIACAVRSDSADSDSSVEVDCHAFDYPVNQIKTKDHLPIAMPLEVSTNSVERFKSA